MNTAACYLVAVLHASPADSRARPEACLEPVHLFTLPADAVDARRSDCLGRPEAAAGLAFELATTDPAWLPPPWADLARRYHAAGLRPFHRGDAMVVLPPGSVTTVLRYADHGWQHLATAATGGGPGC